MIIAHTADVHIRALSRHDEYRQVFKAFIDDCKAQNVDHIFIGGDIFHTKVTGISPEYIELLTWWLTEMAKVAPVHMVLGNHDGNLSNLTRQDAVTPIVEALNNPRVFLYKKSGVYNFAPGYNWCVFSCFDEDGWEDVKPVPGDINIATFHGPVCGSVTETGWDIEEDRITADFFKDYDFCMLGDIHRQQFLGYRGGKPWIGYPGTPIQQNYAEDLNHGYYLWDIKNSSDWSVVNRSLPNPKPFITIDWAGSLEKILKLAESCPTGTRFRIRSNVSITQDDVHLLSETLKISMNASEVIYKIDSQLDTQLVKTNSASIAKTSLRSPEVISKLLRDYYKDLNLTESDADSLGSTAKSYLQQVANVDDLSRNSKWTLKRLEWDNMFAYGEKNIVNFDKLNGIVGIFGPNRTGKSSIVGTLMYTLFNSSDRGPIKNINICNVRKNYCSAKAVFDHNGSTYVVERQTTKSSNKKGIVNASTNLNLFKFNETENTMEDLCGEQRNDTEKSIRSLLGHPDDFLITALSAQGEINQFLSQGSTKRRSILSKFLDLDIFDRMHEISSKEVSNIKAQLKNFPDRNWDEQKNYLETSIEEHKNKIQNFTDKISENQTTLASLKLELSKHNASSVSQDELNIQEKKLNELEKKSNDYIEKISSLENDLNNLRTKLVTLKNLMDSIDVDELLLKQDAQRNLQNSIINLKHEYDKEESLLLQYKKSLKILDEVPCSDFYPTCKFIKDAHDNKKRLDLQSNKVIKILEVLERSKEMLFKVQDDSIEILLEKYNKASDLSSKINLEMAKKETDLVRCKSLYDLNYSLLLDAKDKTASMKLSLNNNENYEVSEIRKRISELTDNIKNLDFKKLDSASQLGKFQSLIEKLNEEKNKRDFLLQNIRIQELISNAFSKKGIPLLVIKSQLPVINTEVSKILQGIVDFTIELESDEETDSLEIYINYGDSRRIIELCSGMEKTISALALRVAMINVSSLPKPDFFIIDEGFGTLDSSGVESCGRLLTSLKRYFKTVVVITHVDGIKDCTDFILEITKKEKDSRVEFD